MNVELELLKTVFEACLNTKAEDLAVIDIRGESGYADFILMATGSSDRHVRALSDAIFMATVSKLQQRPLGTEGEPSFLWLLMDYGSVICHLFQPEMRQVYRLQDMWPQIPVKTEKEVKVWFNPKVTRVVKKTVSTAGKIKTEKAGVKKPAVKKTTKKKSLLQK